MEIRFKNEINKIQNLAQQILMESPDPPVRIKLLRDVLNSSTNDKNLTNAYHDLEKSKWFAGRKSFFQKQYDEFNKKGKFKILVFDLYTFINRAIDLGLRKDHSLMVKIRILIESVFEIGVSNAHHLFYYPFPTNRVKILDSIYELQLAQCLSLLSSNSSFLSPVLERWHVIAKTAFQSGQYNRYDEKKGYESVYKVIFEADKCQRFRITGDLACHECLELFNNQACNLEPQIEKLYFQWKRKREVTKRLSAMSIYTDDRRKKYGFVGDLITSLNKLSDFRSWNESFGNVSNLLWKLKMTNGIWDFGNNEGAFPLRLSNSWRGKYRKHDWSTRILILMTKYYNFYNPINT